MRVAVFIDNSNVFKSLQKMRRIDKGWACLYNPLILAQKLAGNRELANVYFYCVPPPPWLLQESEESKKKHATASKYYSAIQKLDKVTVKYGYLQGGKNDCTEKNVDTQISSDMVASAALGEFDVAILVSNDGDFKSAIANTKKLGKKVEHMFFKGYVSGALEGMSDVTRRARRSHFELMDLS